MDIKASRTLYMDYEGDTDTPTKDDFTIVIPTLNEEEAIGPVIEELLNEGFYDILMIDGYSSDNTVQIAKKYDINILMQHGKGKTGALKTAIEHVRKPYIIIMDGDFTYPTEDIEKFMPHMPHYNEIIGARSNGRGHIPALNRLGNWIINKSFNLFFSASLTDVCSGLYALNTQFAKDLVLVTQGFDVEVEIAAQATKTGKITEIPIKYRERIGIQKLQPFRDGMKIMLTIFKWARILNPIVFFSFLLGLSIFPALLLLLRIAIEWFQGVWHSGLSLVAVLITILANQAITFSFLSSQQKKIEQQLNNNKKQ